MVATSADTLMCALVRAWAGAGGPPSGWGRAEVDAVWPDLVRHRVEASLGALIPPELLDPRQAAAVRAGRGRTASLLMELERILPSLADADCAPVVLKGAGLALAAYPDPATRWFADLDLLVPRARLDQACARLEALGYRPHPSREAWAAYDRHHLHRVLAGPGGALVELHWDLTVPSSVYRSDLEGLGRRTLTVPLGRCAARVAGPVDQVLHGLYQNLSDGFADLRRWLDLAVLARGLDAEDWAELLEVATVCRVDRALELELHIMKQMVGAGDPELVFPRPLEPWAWRLLDGLDVTAGLLRRRATEDAGYNRFLHLVLVPGPRLRVREVLRLLWPRNPLDPGEAGLSAPARILARFAAGGRNAQRMVAFHRRASAAQR